MPCANNAYLNTPYMATPYSASSKDSYTFYHSQVGIQIDCTLGILLHCCWAFLRSAIHMSVREKNLVAVVCTQESCTMSALTAKATWSSHHGKK
jgi:hypothetical protein